MKIFYKLILASMTTFAATSCADFVEIDPPRTDLVRATVFTSDATAKAATLDIYYQMANVTGFGSGGLYSVSFLSAIAADESINWFSFLPDIHSFHTNELVPSNSWVLALWSDLYKTIYKANAIIEGLENSSGVSAGMKQQLLGEAYFVRAFCHFYVVNLFGDAPLVLTTDYKKNQVVGRTATADVYAQIVIDLDVAQQKLADNYSYSADEKTRPSKAAATAMLARVHLYLEQWAEAEAYATEVIGSGSFSLGDLSSTFLKNNSEAIWQLYPLFGYAYDWEVANIYTGLQPLLVAAFETDDQRNVNWTAWGVATKYKSYDQSRSEYTTVLRLAELYLIRAEARARLGNISGAQEDVNVIRTRAGLPNTTADDENSLLAAIGQERRVELFAEWGHRWLDLKRWGRADEIMAPLKAGWQTTDQLFPIPESQIMNDPSMTHAQNPGY